jgi:hypothetical protein
MVNSQGIKSTKKNLKQAFEKWNWVLESGYLTSINQLCYYDTFKLHYCNTWTPTKLSNQHPKSSNFPKMLQTALYAQEMGQQRAKTESVTLTCDCPEALGIVNPGMEEIDLSKRGLAGMTTLMGDSSGSSGRVAPSSAKKEVSSAKW